MFKKYYELTINIDKVKILSDNYLLLNVIKDNNECYCINELKINGNDLVKLGYNGKDIGMKLNELLSIVIEDNSLNNKDLLVEILNKCD